ncbi:MAG: DUF2062 domain-containing protein [Pseudomonadota bacterium]
MLYRLKMKHWSSPSQTTGERNTVSSQLQMPKQTLKSIVPSAARIREIKALRVLGDWVYEGNLWHINRYSASMAFFVGLFLAFMPVPGQMVLAALMAIRLRCNLPLSVGLVWITNPVTMPAIFFLAYKVGALLVDVPIQNLEFEMSLYWFSHKLSAVWKPLLLGCLVCGLFFGCLGYFVISLLWRWHVTRRWHQRKKERAARSL